MNERRWEYGKATWQHRPTARLERMPIANYPPDFVQGVLIGAWAQVFGMIQENRKLPFE